MSLQPSSVIPPFIFLLCLLLGAIAMIGSIIHLAYHICKMCKKEDSQSVVIFLVIALIGILAFLFSTLSIMTVIVQLVVLDASHSDASDEQVALLRTLKYLSAFFDSFGHLSMLTIFVCRLHLCFNNSFFGYTKLLRNSMFCILGVLIVSSIFIAVEIIINGENSFIVMVSQIVWELGIEGTSVWILYLFTSALYQVLKMNLRVYFADLGLRNQSSLSFVETVATGTRTSSISISTAVSICTADIDGTPADKPAATTSEPKNEPATQAHDPQQAQILNLIRVINKMTFLVLIAVLVSLLSIVGNIVTLHSQIDILWLYVFPAADVMTTAFMLYLQFYFTEPLYERVCCKLDTIVLQICLKLNIYFLKRAQKTMKKHKHRTSKVAPPCDVAAAMAQSDACTAQGTNGGTLGAEPEATGTGKSTTSKLPTVPETEGREQSRISIQIA